MYGIFTYIYLPNYPNVGKSAGPMGRIWVLVTSYLFVRYDSLRSPVVWLMVQNPNQRFRLLLGYLNLWKLPAVFPKLDGSCYL